MRIIGFEYSINSFFVLSLSYMAYLDQATEILDRVKGKPLSLDERKRLTLELATLMLQEASATMTSNEKTVSHQLSRLMRDPVGKAFTAAMTDQCFRSHTHERMADQMIYLLNQLGVPHYLNGLQRTELYTLKTLGPRLAQFLVPFAAKTLRKQTEQVILPGEAALLTKHLQQRRGEGVHQNLNHLGEAVLSEAEANKSPRIRAR